MKPIEPSSVAALAYDEGSDEWYLLSCTGDADAGEGVDSLFPSLARYKRVWVWEGQPVVYRIAAACHLDGIVDDEKTELKLTKPGFTSFRFPARLYIKGARYKTVVNSLRDFISSHPVSVPPSLDGEAEWVCGVIRDIGVNEVDAYSPMEVAQAEFSAYTKSAMNRLPGYFGTDFDEPFDGVGGLVGVSDDALERDQHGVYIWDVSSLYPSIASCMPLPTGDGEYDYTVDGLDELPDDSLWIAEIITPDGLAQWVTSVDYCRVRYETTEYSASHVRTIQQADVQRAILYDSISGLYRHPVDRWYKDKKDADGIVKEYYKKKMNSFFGSLAMRYSKDKERAVYRDGRGFEVDVVGRTEHEPGSLFLHQVFIVAYGHAILSKALADYADHVIYYDTDSVHLVGVDPSAVRLQGVPVGDRDDDLGQWTLRAENATVRYFGLRRYAIRDGDDALLSIAGYRAPTFLQRGDWNRIAWRELDGRDFLPSLTYTPGVDSLERCYTPYRITQYVYPYDTARYDTASLECGGAARRGLIEPKAFIAPRGTDTLEFTSFASLPKPTEDVSCKRRQRLLRLACHWPMRLPGPARDM